MPPRRPEKFPRMTLRQFAKAMKRTVPFEIQARIGDVQRKVAFDIYAGTLKRWPVDTGHSRANWLIGINSPVREIREADKKQKGKKGAVPSAMRTEGKAAVAQMSDRRPDQVIWISNNVPYAEVIEFGLYPNETGFSKQAPQGAVRVTIDSVIGKAAASKNVRIYTQQRS